MMTTKSAAHEGMLPMAAEASSPRASSDLRRLIVAASIGNALEWFDLVVYASFALIISKVFFPTNSSTISLMLTLGTFGASYVVRPLGALVLGAYADRKGRNAALLVSILTMLLGTAVVGLMPSYEHVGLLAPFGVLAARLLQGFSAGGEFGSATALLVEYEPKRGGFLASWQFASQGLSMMLASGFGFVLTGALSPEQLQSWGWRLPFIFGLLVGPIGFYIRRKVPETGLAVPNTARSPIREMLAGQKEKIVVSVGLFVLSTTATYMIIYMPTFAARQLHLPLAYSFAGAFVPSLIIFLLTPLIGHWSDKVGRLRIMWISGLIYAITIYPLFVLMDSYRSLVVVISAMIWLGLFKAIYMAPFPALMAGLFPAHTRSTGMSFAYSLGTTIFGSFTPLAVTWLIEVMHSSRAPGLYLLAGAVLSLLSIVYARQRLGAE